MRTVSIALLIPFLALTAYAVYDVGYIGIFDYHRHSSAGWQVFSDLVIALVLLLLMIAKSARTHSRSLWPWFAATLFLGSIAPLIYFAVYGDE